MPTTRAHLMLAGLALAAYDMEPHRPTTDEQTAVNRDPADDQPAESRQARRARERAERKGARHDIRP